MQVQVIKFIQKLISPFFDMLFQLITMTSEELFLILSITMFLWCINKNIGYKLVIISVVSIAINTGLKEIFNSARPVGNPEIRSLRVETATGSSFPSGHTQEATVFWGTLMTYIKKTWIYIMGTILILLVAISRLYLGVHWPIDVIGGIIIGVLMLYASSNFIINNKNLNSKYAIAMATISMIVAMFFLKNNYYYKIFGTISGFYIGYIMENKYIKFHVNTNLFKQILKLFLGLVVLLMLKILIKNMLPNMLLSDFFRYGLIGFWVTCGAPYIFKTLGLVDKGKVV